MPFWGIIRPSPQQHRYTKLRSCVKKLLAMHILFDIFFTLPSRLKCHNNRGKKKLKSPLQGTRRPLEPAALRHSCRQMSDFQRLVCCLQSKHECWSVPSRQDSQKRMTPLWRLYSPPLMPLTLPPSVCKVILYFSIFSCFIWLSWSRVGIFQLFWLAEHIWLS